MGHISKRMQESKSSRGTKAGRKGRNAPREQRQSLHPAPPAPSGHDHRHKWRATPAAPKPTKYKYILTFAVFGLRKSRENTKHPQKIIYFCPFLPKICPDRLKICHDESRKGSKEPPCLLYREHTKRDPPHSGSGKSV